MPMIDVYATSGTFADSKTLARNLAATLMKIEQVPDIPIVPTEHRGIRPRPSARGAVERPGRQQLRQGAGAHERGGA